MEDTGFLGDIVANTCTAWNPHACSGQQYSSQDGGFTYSWWSNNTNIAPTTGSTTGSSGQYYGQAGGTGYGVGQVANQQCQSQSTGMNNVQIPTSLSVISAKALPPTNVYGAGCSVGLFGFQSDVVYQVLDQNTPPKPIRSSAMEPQEQDLNYVFNGQNEGNMISNWVDIMGGSSQITNGRKFTDSNGTFEDAPFGVCATGTFTATFTQPISVLIGGSQRYVVRTNNWAQTGTAPGKGTPQMAAT